MCFGVLSASGEFRLPAASPAFSSLVISAAVVAYMVGFMGATAMAGAHALGVATLLGCALQVAVQAWRTLSLRLGAVWRPRFGAALAAVALTLRPAAGTASAAVQSCVRVLRILLPATVATGSVQINAVVESFPPPPPSPPPLLPPSPLPSPMLTFPSDYTHTHTHTGSYYPARTHRSDRTPPCRRPVIGASAVPPASALSRNGRPALPSGH